MNTYVYKLDDVNYINLTNQCTNDCTFCVRRAHSGVGGYDLHLEKEPCAQDVIDILNKDKTDVVFCGLGEPTIKIDELKKIAEFVKSYGGKVRVNTNGHANKYHNRNVAAELAGLVDEISISLNGVTPRDYQTLCLSEYGEAGFDYMLDFAKECVKAGIRVTLSVVDVIPLEEIEKAKEIAREIGADFRIRAYIE